MAPLIFGVNLGKNIAKNTWSNVKNPLNQRAQTHYSESA